MDLSFSVDRKAIDYSGHAIVIVDRHPLSRSCLARVIRSEFPGFAVIEFEAGHEMECIAGTAVSLAAVNTEKHAMTEECVLRNLASVHRSMNDGPIMLLTQLDEAMITDTMIASVVRFGVRGYITETISVDVAIAALRLVIAGGAHFPRSVAIGEISANIEGEPPPAAAPQEAAGHANGSTNASPAIFANGAAAFTAREQQVLAALRRGLSNKVIAGELDLSLNTIKVHVSRIMHKLHATNRTEAVVLSQKTAEIDQL